MLEWYILTGLMIVTYASYTDWRTTEVPDWLTYGGIAVGLFGRALISYQNNEPNTIIAGLVGFAIFWTLGCTLYYTAQWGGGDAKLLMALGALLGIDPYGAIWDELMVYFTLNLLVIGGIYGLIYTLVLGFTHWNKTKAQFKKLLNSSAIRSFKLYAMFGSLGLLAIAFAFQYPIRIILVSTAVILFLSHYLYVFTKSVEDAALIKKVQPNKLMEGDWVLDTVKHKGKMICSPKDLGLTLDQISKLIEIKKSVTIKAGIPFIPAFFFTYLITLYAGNLFLFLLRYSV